MTDAVVKPCPWCGSTMPPVQHETDGAKWGALSCAECSATAPDVRTGYGKPETWYADALEAWNQRGAEAVQDLEVIDDGDLEGVLLADGLEDAFVGLVRRFSVLEPIACYDIDLVLQIYMERDGMTIDEAQEYFEFNVIGAYAGDRTPCFLQRGKLPT